MKQALFFCFFIFAASVGVKAQSLTRGQDDPIYSLDHLATQSGIQSQNSAGYDAKADVEQVIAKSNCTSVNAGKPKEPREAFPAGYLQGVVKTFVRSLCRAHDVPTPPWMGPRQAMGRTPMSLKNGKDALDLPRYRNMMGSWHANSESGEANADLNIAKTYTLLLSLGMAESAGKTKTGIDRNGNHKGGSSTNEAGLFQVSQNSDVSNSPQNQVIVQYARLFRRASAGGDSSALEKVCLNGDFNAAPKLLRRPGFDEASNALKRVMFKISDSPAKVPNPADFQTLMLGCPAAATEYSAVLARVLAAHNGPLVRQKISPSASCFQMMTSITQKYEADSAHFCSSFKDPVDDENPATNDVQPNPS